MSNSEQFCLRWNNHQSTLVSVFENLLDTNVLIDCTLCAEGKFLKAHRVVLSACSPIFKDMMAIQEDKHPIVFLNDVSFLEMRAMLDYMYKGEVNIVQDQLDSFLRTAAALQIKGLTDQGGGGSDEPPAKKGPGRKTGMSDAPESPLVGNAPLREGSMSPTRRRRRVPRRPDSADDQSAENSCDIPSAPQTGSLAPAPSNQSALSSANQSSLSAADLLHHGPVSSTPTSASRLPPVRKHEPIDQTQVVKQEYVEEPQEDIEDLTLDDDEDYNDNMSTVSDMAKPGTSFHHSQSNQGDFGVDWNPIMANQSGTDDVFLRATEAINNQSTTQGDDSSLEIEIVKEELANPDPPLLSRDHEENILPVITISETTGKPEIQTEPHFDLTSTNEESGSDETQKHDVGSPNVVRARFSVIPTSSLQKPELRRTQHFLLKRLLAKPKQKIKKPHIDLDAPKAVGDTAEVSPPNISLVPTHTLLAKNKKFRIFRKVTPPSDSLPAKSNCSQIITPSRRVSAPVFQPILPKPSSSHSDFTSPSTEDPTSSSCQGVQLGRPKIWAPPIPSRRIIIKNTQPPTSLAATSKKVTVRCADNHLQASSLIRPVVPNKMAVEQIREILSPSKKSFKLDGKN